MEIIVPTDAAYATLKGNREKEISSGRCGFCSGRCGKCLDANEV